MQNTAFLTMVISNTVKIQHEKAED